MEDVTADGYIGSYKPLPRIKEYEEVTLGLGFDGEDGFTDWDTENEQEREEDLLVRCPQRKSISTLSLDTITTSADLLARLSTTRYWIPRGPYIPTVFDVTVWFNQPRFSCPRRFRRTFRMSREVFMKLLSRIETHAVFQNRSKSAKQTSVRYQLATFLYRLGSKASGGSQDQVGDSLGLGAGTVLNFCRRVITAILSLRSEFIVWPSLMERAAHKQRVSIASQGVFSNCLGFVDGTFITLEYAPLHDWYFYYNRKSSYAINAMVVCNDRRRILYVRAGDTSAVHDARVYDNSQLSQHPERFFEPGEYLIGDSAYTPSDHMIPPFKKPRSTSRDCRLFNSTLSSRRIAIEHVFGMLKARFPSITCVSIHIRDGKTHQDVVNWFETACILHNFLLDEEEVEWDYEEDFLFARRHQLEVEQHQREIENDGGRLQNNRRIRNGEVIRESILRYMRGSFQNLL